MSVEKAMEDRYSSRKYLDKPIEKEKLDLILKSGQLCPSTFGLEPVRFIVVRPASLLYEACFSQPSLQTADIAIVYASSIKRLEPHGPSAMEHFRRTGLDIQAQIDDFEPFYRLLESKGRLESWARSQAYIPATAMCIQASELGIQSCILEGIDEDLVKKACKLDSGELVNLVVVFGYPADKPYPRLRRSIEELTRTL